MVVRLVISRTAGRTVHVARETPRYRRHASYLSGFRFAVVVECSMYRCCRCCTCVLCIAVLYKAAAAGLAAFIFGCFFFFFSPLAAANLLQTTAAVFCILCVVIYNLRSTIDDATYTREKKYLVQHTDRYDGVCMTRQSTQQIEHTQNTHTQQVGIRREITRGSICILVSVCATDEDIIYIYIYRYVGIIPVYGS